MEAPLLEVRHLTKSYTGGRALDGVDFQVFAGEVHCLLGANGAGKSTLIKCISGAVAPTGGQILLNGEPLPAGDPAAVLERGIATIYQELDLAPDLTVAESIYLGQEPRIGPFLGRRAMRRGARMLLERLGHAEIGVDTTVRTLRPAAQQIVSIARALSSEPRLLIMDEPSSILDGREIDVLFAVVRHLVEQGMGVIYISHLLGEIAAIGHRITVLRDGRTVASGLPASTPADELVARMVGGSPARLFPERSTPGQEVVLSVRDLCREPAVRPVSFDLRAGEILGIAGLVGAGRTELLRLIYGLDRPDRGQVCIGGEPLPPGRPARAIATGMGFAPEDRKSEGLMLEWSLVSNVSLADLRRLSRFGIIDAPAERAEARRHLDALHTKYTDIERPVRELSGGNQQKVVLARWLLRSCRILLLDEPTRGVDVGVRAEIYRIIVELAARGLGVIVVSSDLAELIGLCGRILVMRGGTIVAEVDGSSATEEALLHHCVQSPAPAIAKAS
jgi:ribose transport system ATP-binding protein